MTHKFTLDTNCIIDLEENRPNAQHVRSLISAWKNGRVELAVVAVSASENQKGGAASRDFTVFETKLGNVGLGGVHHLLPLAIWDVFYWDHALWSCDEMEKLASEIRGILFPHIKATPPANIDENSPWRNQLCDVLVAWSCIYHKWDCLVTSDKNFHDHKDELKKLGLREVLYPEDAARLCTP
jgi:hypothetical protein